MQQLSCRYSTTFCSAPRASARDSIYALGHMFVASPPGVTTLEAVAAIVFRSLGLSETEERNGANYPPDEHHFIGYASNVEVVVADADDDRLERYPFAVTLKRPMRGKGNLSIDAEPVAIAIALARAGLRTSIPKGAWYRVDWDGQGTEYVA